MRSCHISVSCWTLYQCMYVAAGRRGGWDWEIGQWSSPAGHRRILAAEEAQQILSGRADNGPDQGWRGSRDTEGKDDNYAFMCL